MVFPVNIAATISLPSDSLLNDDSGLWCHYKSVSKNRFQKSIGHASASWAERGFGAIKVRVANVKLHIGGWSERTGRPHLKRTQRCAFFQGGPPQS